MTQSTVRIPVSPRAVRANAAIERVVNRWVRAKDRALGRLHLGGRKANYDDLAYEFVGGAKDELRMKHYDKSLRLLWKAEEHTPFLSFRDASAAERQMLEMATRALTPVERAARERLGLPEYRALLERTYTPRQREAIVAILAAIGHGEAYAWLVSAELLNEVKSTGARGALTMQVVEEAKHFVVLRELLKAFDAPIRRQSVWEYVLLENVYKAKGLEKFFGMNVLVESIALSFFGLLGEMPGLEVLRLFHLDEARHTALPGNYLKEFPLTRWQRLNPAARMRRLGMILPALAIIPSLEGEMAELGIDAFEFGGSVIRKAATLAERAGFDLPLPSKKLFPLLNQLFNAYCRRTRDGFSARDFFAAETTVGERQLAIEREIFDGTFRVDADPSIARA